MMVHHHYVTMSQNTFREKDRTFMVKVTERDQVLKKLFFVPHLQSCSTICSFINLFLTRPCVMIHHHNKPEQPVKSVDLVHNCYCHKYTSDTELCKSASHDQFVSVQSCIQTCTDHLVLWMNSKQQA